MPVKKKTEIILDHRFDPKTCRHYLNDQVSVLHCHHYATLYTQLADDCGFIDAKKLLAEVAEDIFFDTLSSYYKKYKIDSVEDRIAIAVQYYALSGLGEMEVIYAGIDSGEVELAHSHLDAGWIKKWGNREKPVNFITCGYISGMFSAIFDKPARSYITIETKGIVSGAERSNFKVTAN